MHAAHPALAPVRQMMTQDALNETTDEAIFECVEAVLSTRSSVSAEQPRRTRLAPYITLKLLFRVHEIVVKLRNQGRCPLAKQKVFAWAVLDLTGVDAPPDVRDVESIGNRLDKYITRQYCD